MGKKISPPCPQKFLRISVISYKIWKFQTTMGISMIKITPTEHKEEQKPKKFWVNLC